MSGFVQVPSMLAIPASCHHKFEMRVRVLYICLRVTRVGFRAVLWIRKYHLEQTILSSVSLWDFCGGCIFEIANG